MVQCTKLKTTCIGDFFPPSTSSHSIYYSLVCECATRCPQSAVILHAHYKCLCTEVFVRIVLMESLYRVSGYLISSLCVSGPNFNAILKSKYKCWKVNISVLLDIYRGIAIGSLSLEFAGCCRAISEEKLLLDLSNFEVQGMVVSVLTTCEWRENSFCSLLFCLHSVEKNCNSKLLY